MWTDNIMHIKGIGFELIQTKCSVKFSYKRNCLNKDKVSKERSAKRLLVYWELSSCIFTSACELWIWPGNRGLKEPVSSGF